MNKYRTFASEAYIPCNNIAHTLHVVLCVVIFFSERSDILCVYFSGIDSSIIQIAVRDFKISSHFVRFVLPYYGSIKANWYQNSWTDLFNLAPLESTSCDMQLMNSWQGWKNTSRCFLLRTTRSSMRAS